MYNAKYFRYEDVDDDLVESWKNLGLRSREDNAYLSPDFVLPAIKYLADDSRVYITAAYREEDSSLCGIGVFTYRFGTIDFPLPHFESFKSTHSYLTGVLLEEVDALNILKEMLSLIKRSSPRVFGIKF